MSRFDTAAYCEHRQPRSRDHIGHICLPPPFPFSCASATDGEFLASATRALLLMIDETKESGR